MKMSNKTIEEILATADPEHLERLIHLSNMHTVKNSKYGKSFDKGMDKYGMVSWELRDDDKANRFDQLIKDSLKQTEDGKWYLDTSANDSDESIHDTLLDRANYIIMLDMWLSALPKKSTFNKDSKNIMTTEKSKDRLDYEAHAIKKLLTNSLYTNAILKLRTIDLESGKGDRGTREKQVIGKETFQKKLDMGWCESDILKEFSVMDIVNVEVTSPTDKC